MGLPSLPSDITREVTHHGSHIVARFGSSLQMVRRTASLGVPCGGRAPFAGGEPLGRLSEASQECADHTSQQRAQQKRMEQTVQIKMVDFLSLKSSCVSVKTKL